MSIKYKKGFTLIELMVVLVIIFLLLSYAIPTYRQYVLRSQRSEAQNALLQLTGIQERFYANSNRYGTADEINLATLYPAPTASNNLHFAISMESTNTTYIIKASPFGSQSEDTECPIFILDNLGQKTPAGNCW